MSDSTLQPPGPDCGLLFGILALQLDFIGPATLQRALAAWNVDRTRPMGDLLLSRQMITPGRKVLLDSVVREYLAQHGQDVSRGIAAACTMRSVPMDVLLLINGEIRADIATFPGSGTIREEVENFAGMEPSGVGTPTSSGTRFRFLRPHASGALGRVSIALDEELHREVALKEIQPAYAHDSGSRARFIVEAEITGSLEHPGIVPVYGLGAHLDGRPYYAMRFIKGECLQDAIDRFHKLDVPGRDPSERRLTLRGLLNRFIDVCNAIAYAHSRGVIHRDIKPANIMLGSYGETLVVDWGLAKVFDRPQTPDASVEIVIRPTPQPHSRTTLLGQAVGTPAFMPPEQAAGKVDQVTPANDVYSLGSTLYMLLTGEPPYSDPDATTVLRQVIGGKFPPPRRIKREVSPALEAIVLKAMAHRPEDRYRTARELAKEIEHWLADEPVTAYREPMSARLGRWARRNRPLVSSLMVLTLTTMVALAVGLWAVNREEKRTKQSLALAERNLQLAQQAVDQCYLLATEDPLLQEERMRPVRKILLEKALPFYKGFRLQKPDDPNIKSELGRNLFRVARITSEIGSTTEAITSYKQALEVFDELAEQYPDRARYRVDLARIHNDIGNLQNRSGLRTSAARSHEMARALRAELVSEDPDESEYQSDLASTYTNLGALRQDEGKQQEALSDYQKAYQIQFKLAHDFPRSERFQMDLAATCHNLGVLLAERDQRESARKHYRQARTLRQNLVKNWPRRTKHRADLASTLDALGLLHADDNNETSALKACEAARDLRQKLAQEFPDVAEFQSHLAGTWINLGGLYKRNARTAEALKSYKQAQVTLERLRAEHPEEVVYQFDLAGTYLELGNLHRDTGKVTESLDWYGKVFSAVKQLQRRNTNLSESRLLQIKAHRARAEALGKLNRHTEAANDWKAAADVETGDDQRYCRIKHAASLARAGTHEKAVKEAEALFRGTRPTGELTYDLACICALAAGAASADATLGTAERASTARRYGERAIAFLEEAKKLDFFSKATHVMMLTADDDLKSIRELPAFKKLLKDVSGQESNNG